MAYHALYLDDGTLVGVTNQEPVALPGVSIKEIDTVPNLASSVWNIETLEFVRNSALYSKLEFMTRFTIQERLAAKSSTDPVVQDVLNLLNLAEFVDITDSNTINGVMYLAYVGIITQQRAVEILQ